LPTRICAPLLLTVEYSTGRPRLAVTGRIIAIESSLAGFGAERLADATHGGVWYIGVFAAPGVAGLLFEKEARAFIGEYLYPLYGAPPR